MYSPAVIEKNVATVEKRLDLKLIRYDFARCEEMQEHLVSLMGTEKLKRALTKEESAFIVNEQVLSQLDFSYWAERYATIEYDGVVGGGIGKMRFGHSQQILLDLIAKIQIEQYERHQAGEVVDGILIADHKARQVWHTALARALQMHRATLMPHSRCIGASVDDQKIQILYERDLLCYEHLPWYLKPGLIFNEKNEHLSFSVGSKITYLISTMKSSFGQGSQFDFGHLTEVSEWLVPTIIELDFFPTLPQSPNTLCILESRANGRGNWWHRFTEDVRHGKKQRWRYSFIPWYSEPKKYRRTPPVGWQPSEVAYLHAKKVKETSAEWIGKSILIPKEQLYWWETTREEYRVAGRLNFFLSNYCATPEESFQHAGDSAFDSELLDKIRTRAKWPDTVYEFEKVA